MEPQETLQQFDPQFFLLSADLFCIAGLDGFFKKVNPSFTRVLGYSEEELLSHPFTHFLHPDDVAVTNEEVESLGSEKDLGAKLFQNRYRCADGSYRWLEWRSVVSSADRNIYATARDITEQKLTAEKLQEYAKELERSNGELQQFAYVASHDLQEPLRAVSGCVQMLAERNIGKLDEKSLELIGYAVDGAHRMQTLINDLLAYSRVGTKGINKSFVDANAVAEKAVQQLYTAITESNAVVIVDPLPRVWADAVQLTQLFQNLIGNAIKFRTERRPEIHVQAEQSGGEVIFSVRDNGIGIAPEYHEKVFGLFQRLHRRKEYSGTGIGLSICKKIVDRHGGRIWIESRLGDGTNIRFTLPQGTK